jgi:hypothetical protein
MTSELEQRPPKREERKTNRVYLVLERLSASNIKRLHKFLLSPYFNQSKTLLTLFEVLTDYTDKKKKGFVKEKVWAKVFPGKPYNDTNFRKACSDLMELVEQFMAVEAYLEKSKYAELDRMDYIIQNNVQPLFKGVVNEQHRLHEDRDYRRYSDYYFAYSFEKKFYRLMNYDVKMDQSLNLDKISDNLDLFYLIEKLKLLNNAVINNIIGNKGHDMNDVGAILKLCEHYDLEQHPELAINYYAYQILSTGENLEYYYKLKSILGQYAAQVPQSESISFFDAILNYCVGRVNKGDKEFLQEYFDIFESGISLGIFIVNGELAARRFNNIVIAGLRLGKHDWAQKFVNDNTQLLPADTRNNTYKFNMARVSLYKKDFGNVLHHVRDVEYDDIFINLISKVMITIAYYELDEYEALDTFIETYRTFINRQRDLQEGIKNGYLGFLGFVRRLTRLKSNDAAAVQKLQEEIANARATTVNQEWLLEKVGEFL